MPRRLNEWGFSPGGLIKKEHRWVIDELQGETEAFALTAGERAGPRVLGFREIQRIEDVLHLIKRCRRWRTAMQCTRGDPSEVSTRKAHTNDTNENEVVAT